MLIGTYTIFMSKINGYQQYGLSKLKIKLKMMQNKVLKSLPLKQKLGLNYVAKESKLTMPIPQLSRASF